MRFVTCNSTTHRVHCFISMATAVTRTRPSSTLWYAAYLFHLVPATLPTVQVFVMSWDGFTSPAYETRCPSCHRRFHFAMIFQFLVSKIYFSIRSRV